MRSIACALGCIVLLACCSPCVGADESAESHWWQFGRKKDAAATPSSLTPAGTPAVTQPNTTPRTPVPPNRQLQTPVPPNPAPNDENWMLKSSKSKVSWPRLTKPSNPLAKKETLADAAKNSWVEKQPTPPKPSLMKPVTDGAHKVAQGTKNVWHKTVNALTPGESEPTPHSPRSHVAKRDAEPSFWQKMFGSEPEPQHPATMPGFIAQQRVDAAPSQTR